MEEARLIKIDRNGSKHYEGSIKCDRCDGKGIYYIGVMNGHLLPSPVDNGICFKCWGSGKVEGKWIERTPEYEAKLEAKRMAKRKAKEEAWERELAERNRIEAERRAKEEAERKAEEERIKAEKAISQHVGNIGDKYEGDVKYIKYGSWDMPSYTASWITITMYVYTFKDAQGNVLTWKTQKGLPIEPNTMVKLKGTIKDHTTYKDEKQTMLERCKVEAIPSGQ